MVRDWRKILVNNRFGCVSQISPFSWWPILSTYRPPSWWQWRARDKVVNSAPLGAGLGHPICRIKIELFGKKAQLAPEVRDNWYMWIHQCCKQFTDLSISHNLFQNAIYNSSQGGPKQPVHALEELTSKCEKETNYEDVLGTRVSVSHLWSIFG